jgi:MoxR-like ATPase
MNQKLHEKFVSIADEVGEVLLEREDEIRGGIIALVSGNHIFYDGPPGTGKSMMCNAITTRVEKADIFSYLMTATTTDDAIIGPVKLSALQEDRYERRLENGIGNAHVIFLDEIWKANSAVLNALLEILNEGYITNDGVRVEVPLLTGFFASNETPDKDELQALYDRIALRFYVDPIKDYENEVRVLQGQTRALNDVDATVSLKDIESAREAVNEVEIPMPVLDIALGLYAKANNEGFTMSFRRLNWVLNAVRANAWLNGRDEATKTDLLLPFSATLPADYDDFEKAKILVEETIVPLYAEAREAMKTIRGSKSEFDNAVKSGQVDRVVPMATAVASVSKVVTTFETILGQAEDDDEKALIEKVKAQALDTHQSMQVSLANVS